MSAWVLPDHIADVLPSEARHIEELRRALLDAARSYGYELVMPPLLEHLESLLTGTGRALDLQTFKLVDQLSGRTLGLRADTTPQVARIDAHLLNRQGLARLCYCGPVLNTRPVSPHATREPLQFGAEIYGHAGLEADLEIVLLALDAVDTAQAGALILDLADVRVVKALLQGVELTADARDRVHAALAAKDAPELAALTRDCPAAVRQGLALLIQLYGDAQVLTEAERHLPASPMLSQALAGLKWLAAHVQGAQSGSEPGSASGSASGTASRCELRFDLADLQGYAYYSGMRFGIYTPKAPGALARGGRYDEVGAVFGRNRPAVGFSLDVKELAAVAAPRPLTAAVRAPWVEGGAQAQALQAAMAALRRQGDTVVCVLPGHESELDEFQCDRQLLRDEAGNWVVRPL